MFTFQNIIDLTHPLHTGMPTYPGDKPEPLFRQLTLLKEPDIQITTTVMQLGSHFGTHMDSPRHFFSRGQELDKFSARRFLGKALKLDAVTDDGESINISASQMKKIKAEKPDWILFHTGWSKHWGKTEYFRQNPYLHPETAHFLVKTGIQGVGIDSPSVDAQNADIENYPIHQILLSHDCLIVENLTSLKELPETAFIFVTLPLKLRNSDGAPCRAVALF